MFLFVSSGRVERGDICFSRSRCPTGWDWNSARDCHCWGLFYRQHCSVFINVTITLFILFNHPTYPFFWDSSNLTLTRLPSRDSTFTFHVHFDQVGEGYQAVTPLSLSSCSLEWLLDCTYGGALPQVALLLFHLNIIILYHSLKKKNILGGGRSCDAYGPTSVLGMRQSLGQRGRTRVQNQ